MTESIKRVPKLQESSFRIDRVEVEYWNLKDQKSQTLRMDVRLSPIAFLMLELFAPVFVASEVRQMLKVGGYRHILVFKTMEYVKNS